MDCLIISSQVFNEMCVRLAYTLLLSILNDVHMGN